MKREATQITYGIKNKNTLRRIQGILVISLISLVGMLFGLSTFGLTLDSNIGLSWLFKVRGPIEPPPNMVVVGINGRTPEQLDLPRLPRDWSRTIHAELIDVLVKRGAELIVFDIHFFVPKDQQDDTIFIDAVERSKRVALIEKLDGKRQPVTDRQGKSIGWKWVENTVPPMENVATVATGLGPFPLPKVDAELHQFWVFKTSAADAPTLPAVALQLYLSPLYDDFRAFLGQVDSELFSAVPVKKMEINDAEQLRSAMVRLRRILSEKGALYDRVKGILDRVRPEQGGELSLKRIVSLLKMYAGEETRYLNFYGPPGTIKNIPYTAVIRGDDPNLAEADLDFTGKVVFVGYADMQDPGQPDRFYTVFTRDDGVDLSGVEIMATAFGNLLTDKALKRTNAFLSGVIMMGFGLLVGMIAYLLPAMVGMPLAVLISIIYCALTYYYFSAHAVWLPVTTPLLIQLPVASFFGLFGQHYIERRRAQQMSELISHYVPEDVVLALTGNDPDVNKIDKVVYSTCLATDMADFSAMAEKMDPAELAELLNDYFDSLAGPLKDNFVDVTEFRADAIMCAWTAETPQIDVRRNALKASLQAEGAFRQFSLRNPIYKGGLRIGLEAGMVHVGQSGGGGKFVYSIVGDCANTASRVEGLNKQIGTHILASEAVAEGVEGLLLRDIGRFQFVGKSESQNIFEVIAEYNEASAAERERCVMFAEVIALFRIADWRAAQRATETILKVYPNDGPSQFYWKQCQKYRDGISPPEEVDVIVLSEK